MEEGIPLSFTRFQCWRKWGFYSLAAFLLIGVGWQGHSWVHSSSNMKRPVRSPKKFRYTSPLLDVALPEGLSIRNEPIPFKYKIKSYVSHMEKSGVISHISVYFRDLNDGPWFGVNADREFDAASMMKVPVMIAWLKRAEKKPNALHQVFIYDGKVDMSAFQSFKPRKSLVKGVGYKVEELLHIMISYSDNNATKILYDNLHTNEIEDVLENMDVNNNPHDYTNLVSVVGYSGFYRILYNSAYLNREMSEKALQLLTSQDFQHGIAVGVPQGVQVASKYGEHGQGNKGEDKQLHDFGIVYHPGGPYILGIMTQGNSFDRQGEIIKTISSMVFNEVSANAARRAR